MWTIQGAFMLDFDGQNQAICYAFSLKDDCVDAHFCRIKERTADSRLRERCVYNLEIRV